MRPPPIKWRAVVNSYPCETCGAGPGAWCISTGGKYKYEPHAARSKLASANHWADPEATDWEHSDQAERDHVAGLPVSERPHYELHDGTCVGCGKPWPCPHLWFNLEGH